MFSCEICEITKSTFFHRIPLVAASVFTDTDSLVTEINKTEGVYEDEEMDEKMFNFSNYSGKSKYYDDSKKLVVRKDER